MGPFRVKPERPQWITDVKQKVRGAIALGSALILGTVDGGIGIPFKLQKTWANSIRSPVNTKLVAQSGTVSVPIAPPSPEAIPDVNEADPFVEQPSFPPASPDNFEGRPTDIIRPESSPFPSRPPRTFGITTSPPEGFSPFPFNPQEPEQFSLYRLNVGDSVSVTVQNFPEFSFAGTLDIEGTVPVPILGRFSLLGLTLDEVEAKLQYELFRRYLNSEPEVNATLVGARQVQIAIRGEVTRPGFYSITPLASLPTLLAQTGGTTPDADLRSIIVRRQLIDGSIIEKQFDLYTPLLTGQIPPNFQLQGGDTIIVEKLAVGDDQDYDRGLIARSTLPQQTITIRVLLPTPLGETLRNINLPNGSSFIDVVASLPVGNTLLTRNTVSLMRFDPENNGIVTQKLNAREVIRGDLAQDVPLRDEDVIIVSSTLLGKVFRFLNQVTSPIRTILGFSNFFTNFGRRGLGVNNGNFF